MSFKKNRKRFTRYYMLVLPAVLRVYLLRCCLTKLCCIRPTRHNANVNSVPGVDDMYVCVLLFHAYTHIQYTSYIAHNFAYFFCDYRCADNVGSLRKGVLQRRSL